MEEKKKKKLSFPTALTVLFIVLIFAAILTAIVPAGLYSKLTYNAQSDMFEVTTPDGEIEEMEPTQESLDELGVTGNLDKFLDGSISKPIAVPMRRWSRLPRGFSRFCLRQSAVFMIPSILSCLSLCLADVSAS